MQTVEQIKLLPLSLLRDFERTALVCLEDIDMQALRQGDDATHERYCHLMEWLHRVRTAMHEPRPWWERLLDREVLAQDGV